MKRRHIKFYGVHDLSTSFHLHETELVFRDWQENITKIDVNLALELYNIKKYFDANLKLEKWTDEQFAEYEDECRQIPSLLGRFCSTISDVNIDAIYKDVETEYVDNFWQLLSEYKVLHCISLGQFKQMLDNDEHLVWHALSQRELASTFGQTIAEHLSHNKLTACNLIKCFLSAQDSENHLHFPTEFTHEMRNKVLWDYVKSENANINYLQLLAQAQSTDELLISDKLKLTAREKGEALQAKLFRGNTGISFCVEVTFTSVLDGTVEESSNNNTISYVYNREWLMENQDYPTLLNNFIYLFKYVDYHFRSTLVSNQVELGTLERHIAVRGKKDYTYGIGFNLKQQLSSLQMAAYNRDLQHLSLRLEDTFKWFFEEYLEKEFCAIGFTYNPPSAGTTYAEKCKLLAISIDGVLKQYRLYFEDGFVNRKLLEMSSGHVVFGNLQSNCPHKYAYSISREILSEMFLLFSDQSMMSYIEKTGDSYETLPQLILSEHLKREDFADYQCKDLDWLAERGSIIIEPDGALSINIARVFVLKDLFINEVICPSYYKQEYLQQIDALVSAGDMCYENTLFSRPEQDYLNFELNKSVFSNGLDLRNRYSHDTFSLDENVQYNDYLELLKIMVLIIIKINEELCLKSLIADASIN